MNKIECIKTVSISGNSLVVPLTKELKMLEIEKGDNVRVIIERVQ